jgi:beta-lactamase regulating signal transducer with metallopeptidase domain
MVTRDRRVRFIPVVLIASCATLLHSHVDALMLWVGALSAAVYVSQELRGLAIHTRFVRSLRRFAGDGELAGVWVQSVPGVVPFVAGILRPRIYCDPQMSSGLTAPQQRAVLLHEQHHQRRRDPLRLLLSGAFRPFAMLSPSLAAHLHAREVAREIAADRYAIRNGTSRADVAGALAAVLRLDGTTLAPGFTSVVEARIEALAGQEPPRPGTWRTWRTTQYVVATGLVVVCIGGF